MYLGLDIGSTSLKAAAFDAQSGRLCGRSEEALPLAVDAGGRREQDPAALLEAVCRAFRSLREQTGSRWAHVCGIGLAAQGGSSIVVDRHTGEPATPMILWNDTRAFGHFHQILTRIPPRWWRSFSLRAEPGMGLARLQWLLEQHPDLLHGDRLWVGAGEFICFALTGIWRQDPCHALQSGCYDAQKNRITLQPMQRLELPSDWVAPLRPGHQTLPLAPRLADRLQLSAGTPVAGPYNDHEAGYLSVQHLSARPLEVSLGTAWVGNFVLPEEARGGAPFQFCIPAPGGSGKQVILPLLTGNVTLDWALATFVHYDRASALAQADGILAHSLLPPPGLMALPWLNRPNALCPGRTGCAALFGLGPATTAEDMFRAVVSAMVLEFARVFEAVRKRGAVDSLVLCGGAAKNPHLCSLFAALFDPVPVHRVLEADLMGARGCLYPFDPEIAWAHAVPVSCDRGIDPRLLAAAQTLYQDLFERLCGQVAAGKPYAFYREYENEPA